MSTDPRDFAYWQKRRQHINALTGQPVPPHPRTAAPPGARVDARTFRDGAFPPVVRGEPLSRKTDAAVAALGLTPAAAGAASNVPETYRPLAGLQQNQRGQRARIDTSTILNTTDLRVPVTVAQVRSEGDDAEIMTVTLGLDFEPTTPAASVEFPQDIQATITWGIGGAQFTAQVDWLSGTQLDIAANYIRVDASLPNPPWSAGGQAQPVFLLSAAFAYGAPSAQKNRVRLTQTLPAIANGATSSPVVIPNFATAANLFAAVATGGPLTINFARRANPTPITLASYQWLGGSNGNYQIADGFPIPNGAGVYTVTNSSGVDLLAAKAGVSFQLVL